jgi:hypothetical protein
MPPLSWQQGGALFNSPTKTTPDPRVHNFIPGMHTYSDELEQALKGGMSRPAGLGVQLKRVVMTFLAALTEETRAKGEKTWREGYSPVDFENDYRVETITKALEKKFGFTEMVDILGSGSFGSASAIDDTRVLKLTVDESEVQSGALLTGRRLPHVAEVFGAFWIKNASVRKRSGGPMRKVGVLILERLAPLRVGDPRGHRLNTEHDKFRKLHPEVAFHALRKLPYEKARALMDHASNDLMLTFTNIDDPLILDIGAAVEELRDIGIFAIDVHSGNVGWSSENQCFKLFDIGISSVPQDVKAPTAIAAESLMPRTYVEEI